MCEYYEEHGCPGEGNEDCFECFPCWKVETDIRRQRHGFCEGGCAACSKGEICPLDYPPKEASKQTQLESLEGEGANRTREPIDGSFFVQGGILRL